MTLTAPGEGCPRVSGCCCVTFVGASPRKDLRDRLDRALSEVSATALWKELPDADQPSMQEVSGEEEDDQRTVPEAWLVVVALLVGPVLLGGLLGLLIRARVRGKAPRIALFCALAAPALVAPFVLPVEWLLLGVWDGVLLGLLLAGAMAMVLWLWRRPSPWSLLLLVLSTLLSAAFLEVGSRQLPTPRLAARWQAGRLLAVAPPEADAADDERARLLYPDRFPEDLRERLENRGTDSPETIDRRLAAAQGEMEAQGEFGHVVVNDNLTRATDELEGIVREAVEEGVDSGS